MRGARLDIRNKNRLTPAECMVKGSENLECKAIVSLSSTLQEMMREVKTARHERVVCNDISRGKESAPIQVVNAVDDENEPGGYVYVGKNCVTNAVPLDANISKLQVRTIYSRYCIESAIPPLTPNILSFSTASARTIARLKTPVTAPT